MLRNYLSVALCALFLLFCPIGASAALALNEENLPAALLMEASGGEVLFALEEAVPRDAAGLVRLPALLLLCEAMDAGTLPPDTRVRVSRAAAGVRGATAFLSPDEALSAAELMKCAVMILAGDALYALSEALMPDDAAFVAQVNARLAALGITGGCAERLGGDMRLSALDIGKLGMALMQSPSFCAYSALYYDELLHENGSRTELVSGNKLLRSLPGCDGTATGSSTAAGYCGVFHARREDTGYICVVLGAKNAAERGKAAQEMLEKAFAEYRVETLARRGEVCAEVKVIGGTAQSCALVALRDVRTVLPRNGAYTRKETLPQTLDAPLKAGDVLCEVLYLDADGGVLSRVALGVAEDIPAATYADRVVLVLRSFLHV